MRHTDTPVSRAARSLGELVSLDDLMRDRTSFVIAQRVSTVLNADKIVVLDRGRIAATGTHEKLLETSPIYQDIYESQLGNGNSST